MILMRKQRFGVRTLTAKFDHEKFQLLFGVREWVLSPDSILTLEVIERIHDKYIRVRQLAL